MNEIRIFEETEHKWLKTNKSKDEFLEESFLWLTKGVVQIGNTEEYIINQENSKGKRRMLIFKEIKESGK